MKYIYAIFLTVCLASAPFAQMRQRLAFSLGGNASYTHFKAFENYVDSYNAANADRPGFEALKYNPYGFGFEGEVSYVIGGFYSAFRVARYDGRESRSSLADGQRIYQFKNLSSDLKVGFMTKKGFSMYFAMGLHSFNLLTFYSYSNGMESYGDEKYISGVYTSFKMQGLAGMRYEKKFNKLGFYVDLSAPVNAKNSNEGSFLKHKVNSWETGFPQDHSQYNAVDMVYLPQIYRNYRLGAGIVFYLKDNENE